MISAKLKGGLVLVGVFLLGGLAGGATARAWVQRDYAAQLTGRPGERIARRHLGALARELNLSDEQRERVRAIMDKHRSEREAVMKKLAESCGAPMREHKAKVDAEIRAVLDPEQRKRFDALLTKQRERFPLVGSPPFGPESGPKRRGERGDRAQRKGKRRRGSGPRSARPAGAASAAAAARPPRVMRRYDRDGDGMLSEQEVSAKLWRRISKLDKDQDGLVSTEELRKRRQRRRRSKK